MSGRGDCFIGAMRRLFTCCGLMRTDIELFREVGDALTELINDDDFQPMPTDIAAALLLLYRIVGIPCGTVHFLTSNLELGSVKMWGDLLP